MAKSWNFSNTERNLSFRVLSETSSPPPELPSENSLTLYRSQSDFACHAQDDRSPPCSKISKRRKKTKRKKQNQASFAVILENPSSDCVSLINGNDNSTSAVLDERTSNGSVVGGAWELRQRNVSGGDGSLAALGEVSDYRLASPFGRIDERACSGSVDVMAAATLGLPITSKGNLETEPSLDWNRLMAENPDVFSVEQSPVRYIMDEVYKGNVLRKTTTVGTENDRERVYDTIFRLPWRCELLIDVGFFVCLDSFLSLLTIVPTRITTLLFKRFIGRQSKTLSAADISDISCLIILAFGVILLGRTDISLIYHMIRGQGTIKLYVVYNVLEIFDKLCQSFGGDVLEALFNSVEGLASCSQECSKFWVERYIYDQTLATIFSILHSFVLLAQAITLSTCIVAHNNALLALLVSNNFAEIKSNVFKRFSKDNIHSLVYSDTVERFHISAFLLFVLAQNILEAEGPWFRSFLYNAAMVFFCEVLVDVIKHSFLAKFNDVRPIAYSEFLEDLCRQTLRSQSNPKKRTLTFIPFAPACVVIRVLTPVYAARLPHSPWWWRLFWEILLLSVTEIMLTSLKLIIAMALHKHALWYVQRCQRRRHHLHSD